MPRRARHQTQIELLQGTLDMLVLQTLRWGAKHGYAIGQAIRTGSGELVKVETGSLYPALHRLEQQKLIRSEWRVSDHNQRAKYYQLTPAGRKRLTTERSRWTKMIAAMAGLMNPREGEGRA